MTHEDILLPDFVSLLEIAEASDDIVEMSGMLKGFPRSWGREPVVEGCEAGYVGKRAGR
jgi:hypothetical protein